MSNRSFISLFWNIITITIQFTMTSNWPEFYVRMWPHYDCQEERLWKLHWLRKKHVDIIWETRRELNITSYRDQFSTTWLWMRSVSLDIHMFSIMIDHVTSSNTSMQLIRRYRVSQKDASSGSIKKPGYIVWVTCLDIVYLWMSVKCHIWQEPRHIGIIHLHNPWCHMFYCFHYGIGVLWLTW